MIRGFKTIYAGILLFFICSSAFASTKIYLLPEVEIRGTMLKLGDIAVVEGTEASAIYDVVLAEGKSGSIIVDKRDIQSALSDRAFYEFSIFGNGVRVTFLSGSDKEGEAKKENIVNNGDTVEVTLLKNGVRVEVMGVSLAGGAIGDRVRVRIGKGKILHGIVKGRGRVLLEI